MMDEKVLFVDDENNVLEAIRRQLGKKFRTDTAVGASAGLKVINAKGPYAVIVSDLRMPVMDGIQFLSRVREIAPDTVRMILTGNADLQTAISAVNEGSVFHFLTKPCAVEVLTQALTRGIDQYRLVTAEKELLEKTLTGAVEMLTDLLSLVNPEAFGRSSRIKRRVRQVAFKLEVTDTWRFETAALLSQIGWIALPGEVLKKLCAGEKLEGEEIKSFEMHPMIAADLLKNIPRLQEVADIITYQEKRFDGSGPPQDECKDKDIPLGARVLKVVLDYDLLEIKGLQKTQALTELKKRNGWYDPAVVKALEKILSNRSQYEIKEVCIRELAPQMILAEDVKTSKQQLVITKGQEVSPLILKRLAMFAQTSGIREPIRVFVPL